MRKLRPEVDLAAKSEQDHARRQRKRCRGQSAGSVAGVSELRLSSSVIEDMVGHCFEAYPLEGCGLLAADPGGTIVKSYGLTNAAASAKLYELDSQEFMAADSDADEQGLTIAGVFHSHTHTEAYPSPTDLRQAPVPEWHYVLVSFAGNEPSVRSFRIEDGEVAEEAVLQS